MTLVSLSQRISAPFCLVIVLFATCVCCQQCLVSAVTSFNDCLNYCLNKYGQAEDAKQFFNHSDGLCYPQVVCSKDSYLQYFTNKCQDNFTVSQLPGSNIYANSVQGDSVVLCVVTHGQVDGLFNIICQQGWISSYHTESITEQISKRYHCDVQKHVGKVYPETHAEYYFKLLSNQQQLAAIGYQYGSPSLWDFQGVLGASLFLLIAIINVYECIMEAKKRVD